MPRMSRLAWTSCLLLTLPGVTAAQQRQPPPPGEGVGVTTYGALGSAGSSSVGAAVRWPVRDRLALELETELRRAELTAINASLNLLFNLPSIGRATPYVAAGIGIEQFGYVRHLLDRPVTLQGTAITVNAGGGVSVPVTDRWDVRSDAGWSHGFGRDAPERWRIANGATFKTGAR
jgi:opacity protein-like surface antigen